MLVGISSAPEVTVEVAVEAAGIEVTEPAGEAAVAAAAAAAAAAAIGHRLIGLVGSVATGMCLVAELAGGSEP